MLGQSDTPPDNANNGGGSSSNGTDSGNDNNVVNDGDRVVTSALVMALSIAVVIIAII